MRTACLLTLAATTLVCALAAVGAGATTQSAASCNPSHKYCNSGVLPAGVYTTRYFVPGMRVRVPAGGWHSSQDSPDEFKLNPPHAASTTIRFWIDPRASAPCTDKVLPVNITTPARAVSWLRSNKNFVVSTPKRTTIAGHLSALRVNLNVAAAAPRCSRVCSGPCIDYFLFFRGVVPSPDLASGHTPGATDVFGSGRGEPVRLYFAEIRKPSHLFVVGIDTSNAKASKNLTAVAKKMLATLRLPANLPLGKGARATRPKIIETSQSRSKLAVRRGDGALRPLPPASGR